MSKLSPKAPTNAPSKVPDSPFAFPPAPEVEPPWAIVVTFVNVPPPELADAPAAAPAAAKAMSREAAIDKAAA